jgi:uncharacterized protein (TIGR03000 family)
MWQLVQVSSLLVGVLSLGAAGRVDTLKGKPLPQSVPFSSTRSAALGPIASAAQTVARISATVPQDDAELLIDGELRNGTGLVREVAWPRPAGAPAEVTVAARWRPNNYTVMSRSVRVHLAAGEAAAVDLSKDAPGDTAQIRYVATPAHVVAEMIALAGITKNDVVFEPGCGDARLTIAAVKAGAKRGVGIDLDAERVADSQSKVKEAGLDQRIEIRLGDALAIPDLSEASLVFLYMGDEFNHLIRPILLKQLRVGARIVSHRFTMGDWAPDRTVSLPDEGGNTDLHLWTVTAAVKAAQR